MNPAHNQPSKEDEPLRPHTYDGIQEYDKRLPNWWLLTFYGAIVFAVVYWFYYSHTGIPKADGPAVEAEIAQVEAARLSSAAASLTNADIWKMSRNPVVVAAGKETYMTTCVACHLPSLKGKAENPSAVGASLIGTKWITGGHPLDLIKTVTKGTQRGMQAWGPVLGTKKISEVVAFVLSHHTEGEPIEVVESPAAGVK
ncbi:MAG: cbb3-type cytochrome c oxidase N-terminal domain-containing protein [Nibricoccus sp.]